MDWLRYERHSRPLFIVGPPRSGSSLVVRALQAAGKRGYSEGHIVPLMTVILAEIDNYYTSIKDFGFGRDIAIQRLPQDAVQSRVIDIFEQFMTQSLGTEAWFDKTVNIETIRSLQLLREIWPHSKFLFTYRTAEESIPSALHQFGDLTNLLASCRHWAGCMEAWSVVRRDVRLRSFELDNNVFNGEWLPTVEKLAVFLDLNPEETREFLLFFEEDTKIWKKNRRSYENRLALAKIYTDEDRAFFSICRKAMIEYGFWTESDVEKMRSCGLTDFFFNYTESPIAVRREVLDQPGYFSAVPGGFMLHPSADHRPSTVRFVAVPLEGRMRFNATVSLANPKAHSPVAFQVQVLDPAEDRILASGEAILKPDTVDRIEFSIPDEHGDGTVDVIFSTWRTETDSKNYYCWAHWFAAALSSQNPVVPSASSANVSGTNEPPASA